MYAQGCRIVLRDRGVGHQTFRKAQGMKLAPRCPSDPAKADQAQRRTAMANNRVGLIYASFAPADLGVARHDVARQGEV
mgnify:CR=1 FL=1